MRLPPRALDLARRTRSTPGRAVVVDIDGVLSDAASRQHYLEAPRRDWRRRSSTRAARTRSSRRCKTLLDLLDPDLQIVLLTARPHRVHHLTEAWLAPLRDPLGPARSCGRGATTSSSRDFKQSTVWELRAAGFDLRLAFEDDRRNVAMFRAEGIPCLYVHSGYYD